MADPSATYDVRVTGFWNTSHTFSKEGEVIGTLTVERKAGGLVVGGRFTPVEGEVILLRRDPGLLRSQFSVWTEGREWLGSALRWHLFQREIVLHTGSRPLRILPLPGFRFGWRLMAPKTGEMARIAMSPLGRRTRLEVYRKVDFELVVLSYFLGFQIHKESWWPGPAEEGRKAAAPAPKAPAAPQGSAASQGAQAPEGATRPPAKPVGN